MKEYIVLLNSSFIEPLEKTRTVEYLHSLYIERKDNLSSSSSSDYHSCKKGKPETLRNRTCDCWVCRGVRWRLFEHNEITHELNEEKENIPIECIII